MKPYRLSFYWALAFSLVFACKPRRDVSQTSATPNSPAAEKTESDYFWDGFAGFVAIQKVPGFIITWNQNNRTRVTSSNSGGASYRLLTRTIAVASINYARAVRAGKGEEVGVPHMQPLGLIYNEAFHAWFHIGAQADPKCKPLIDEMLAQKQFDFPRQVWELTLPRPLEMAEEALSELVAQMIDDWSSAVRNNGSYIIPSYEAALKSKQMSLTPEHNGQGERWAAPDKVKNAASQVITEKLYKMAIETMQFGCVDLSSEG